MKNISNQQKSSTLGKIKVFILIIFLSSILILIFLPQKKKDFATPPFTISPPVKSFISPHETQSASQTQTQTQAKTHQTRLIKQFPNGTRVYQNQNMQITLLPDGEILLLPYVL